MRNIIITLLLLFTAHFATAQSGEKWRGAGVVYTLGQPNFDAHPQGAWIAIDTTSGYYWLWDKQAGDWVDGGGMIQPTGTTGAPSYTPDLQHSRFAINTGDSLFAYRGGSWRLINDTPTVSDDQQITISNDTIYLEDGGYVVVPLPDLSSYPDRTELQDTASAIRSDFPSLSGYITGSGTTNELPYWATSSSLGSLTTAAYPSLLELSYIKGLSSSAQTQLNAKHGGSLTSGYVPYSGGGYGLLNSGLYWDNANSRLGIGTTGPRAQLHLSISTGGAYAAMHFQNTTAPTTNNLYEIAFNGNDWNWIIRNSGGAYVANGYSQNVNANGANFHRWFIGSNILAALTSTGLGIGQTTPTARLDVVGSGSGSGTTNFRTGNSLGVTALEITDDGKAKFGSTSTAGRINLPNAGVTVADGISWGGNSNLYRSGGNKIATDGSLDVVGVITWGNFNNQVSSTGAILNPSTLTGSAATNAINLAQTWNTTGSPTAIFSNIINTASASTSKLIDLQVSGVSMFNVSPSGQVGIGISTPAASAKVDITSATQGFLPPRMTTTQRNLIGSPANGLIIFCTDCTATDGSTGVSQTYSSTSWRNHY